MCMPLLPAASCFSRSMSRKNPEFSNNAEMKVAAFFHAFQA